jgi:hypothetical protein
MDLKNKQLIKIATKENVESILESSKPENINKFYTSLINSIENLGISKLKHLGKLNTVKIAFDSDLRLKRLIESSETNKKTTKKATIKIINNIITASEVAEYLDTELNNWKLFIGQYFNKKGYYHDKYRPNDNFHQHFIIEILADNLQLLIKTETWTEDLKANVLKDVSEKYLGLANYVMQPSRMEFKKVLVKEELESFLKNKVKINKLNKFIIDNKLDKSELNKAIFVSYRTINFQTAMKWQDEFYEDVLDILTKLKDNNLSEDGKFKKGRVRAYKSDTDLADYISRMLTAEEREFYEKNITISTSWDSYARVCLSKVGYYNIPGTDINDLFNKTISISAMHLSFGFFTKKKDDWRNGFETFVCRSIKQNANWKTNDLRDSKQNKGEFSSVGEFNDLDILPDIKEDNGLTEAINSVFIKNEISSDHMDGIIKCLSGDMSIQALAKRMNCRLSQVDYLLDDLRSELVEFS